MFLLQSPLLSKQSGLKHFVSTKTGGVSKAPYSSLNLSFMVGDESAHVEENRKLLAHAIGTSDLLIPAQTHSANIRWVDHSNKNETHHDTDGFITDQAGIAIAVMSADCVPVLLYAPDKRLVAAVHAGWRGTVQRIAALAVKEMQNAGADAAQILAYIGPSISQPAYEVGGEVITEMQKFPDPASILSFTSAEKACCNLWEANRQQLIAEGILPQNIEISGLCTATRTDLFYSARSEKPVTGRFAAGIMML